MRNTHVDAEDKKHAMLQHPLEPCMHVETVGMHVDMMHHMRDTHTFYLVDDDVIVQISCAHGFHVAPHDAQPHYLHLMERSS